MSVKGIDFKSKIGEQEVNLKLKEETVDLQQKCDVEYHLAYTQLMRKGIMPRATLERIMVESGIWGPEDDKKLQEIQAKIVRLQMDLESSKTHDEGLPIAKGMGELRAQCLRFVEAKAAVLSNSCESLADQIRRDAYMAYGTVYADTGKPVFKDYNEFLMRASNNEQVVVDIRNMMLQLSTDLFNTSLTGLPEVAYVKGVEKKIEDDAKEVQSKKKPKKAKKE